MCSYDLVCDTQVMDGITSNCIGSVKVMRISSQMLKVFLQSKQGLCSRVMGVVLVLVVLYV